MVYCPFKGLVMNLIKLLIESNCLLLGAVEFAEVQVCDGAARVPDLQTGNQMQTK